MTWFLVKIKLSLLSYASGYPIRVPFQRVSTLPTSAPVAEGPWKLRSPGRSSHTGLPTIATSWNPVRICVLLLVGKSLVVYLETTWIPNTETFLSSADLTHHGLGCYQVESSAVPFFHASSSGIRKVSPQSKSTQQCVALVCTQVLHQYSRVHKIPLPPPRPGSAVYNIFFSFLPTFSYNHQGLWEL